MLFTTDLQVYIQSFRLMMHCDYSKQPIAHMYLAMLEQFEIFCKNKKHNIPIVFKKFIVDGFSFVIGSQRE